MHNVFVFFNDTATTEIYTLSLHDALPIYHLRVLEGWSDHLPESVQPEPFQHLCLDVKQPRGLRRDRKSTRLNSSHANISYAVFCLKKKGLGDQGQRRRTRDLMHGTGRVCA